ncbi:MAG: ribose-5-phosphate isomerase A [Melioribacteraceae bacterium]|nr:MAG: ribose-5-phosphate isomerase A [Melioribacteraceae bacterium]
MQSLKQVAAEKAVEFVKNDMILGLGTGSTTLFALKKISALLKEGKLKNIKGIPTSVQTERAAIELNIPLSSLIEFPDVDLTIDGADEVDHNLNLIKGGGGALLREKIIAQASKMEIIIVDETKMSSKLGKKWAVPVEVIPFALGSIEYFLRDLGAEIKIRVNEDNSPYLTDEKNLIIDANFGVIENPSELADKLNARAGIVEHGLFVGLAHKVISASDSGIKIFEK